ncbi:MAG: hypothetical protein DRJ49_02935 [Thermoprotei archaeon]|nr:MAG: hypothetical protein DRN53_05620 [Thermoprotei archaeon]RLE89473.1 MAG: hypothetical protein DRJ49_02935 [Thermoprotei archaeon]
MSTSNSERENLIKKMASLLKAGATMLADVCPVCSTPLFKLKGGEIVCPKCERRVYLVKSDREKALLERDLFLDAIEDTLMLKISELRDLMESAVSIERLEEYIRLMNELLDALEKVRRMTRYKK